MKYLVALYHWALTVVVALIIGFSLGVRSIIKSQISEFGPHAPVEEEDDLDSPLEDGFDRIRLHPIYFGDLTITCPACECSTDHIGVGMGTIEDRQSEEGEVNDLSPYGIFLFPCGHNVHSRCFAERAAEILNAEESGTLTPEHFDNLVYCEEHDGPDGE